MIVVDDGSDDGTDGILKQYSDSRVRYVVQDQAGVSAARNHGLRLARNSWLAFLDSDDWWQPSKLERQLQVVRNAPHYKAVYTNEIWIRHWRRVNQKLKHRKYGGWIYHHCLPLCIISPSSILLHRTLFESEGTFDDSFPVCEDYDLWLRITRRHPVFFLDENLIVKTGGHSDQLSRSRWGLDRYRIRALEKSFDSNLLSPLQEFWTAKEIVRKAGILAAGYRNRQKPIGAAQYESLANKWEGRSI